MKPEQVTDILEQAAAQLGIKVRYETMTGETMGGGGLCKIRGAWAVIIDRRANASDRAALLVESLASFDTDAVYLPPELREAIVQRRAGREPSQTPSSPFHADDTSAATATTSETPADDAPAPPPASTRPR